MIVTMQKISEQKIYQYGIRGIAVALPKVFAKDHNLEKGDNIEIYRTQINGKDALVLIPQETTQRTEHDPLSIASYTFSKNDD
jgi:hypothetical protein